MSETAQQPRSPRSHARSSKPGAKPAMPAPTGAPAASPASPPCTTGSGATRSSSRRSRARSQPSSVAPPTARLSPRNDRRQTPLAASPPAAWTPVGPGGRPAEGATLLWSKVAKVAKRSCNAAIRDSESRPRATAPPPVPAATTTHRTSYSTAQLLAMRTKLSDGGRLGANSLSGALSNLSVRRKARPPSIKLLNGDEAKAAAGPSGGGGGVVVATKKAVAPIPGKENSQVSSPAARAMVPPLPLKRAASHSVMKALKQPAGPAAQPQPPRQPPSQAAAAADAGTDADTRAGTGAGTGLLTPDPAPMGSAASKHQPPLALALQGAQRTRLAEVLLTPRDLCNAAAVPIASMTPADYLRGLIGLMAARGVGVKGVTIEGSAASHIINARYGNFDIVFALFLAWGDALHPFPSRAV